MSISAGQKSFLSSVSLYDPGSSVRRVWEAPEPVGIQDLCNLTQYYNSAT